LINTEKLKSAPLKSERIHLSYSLLFAFILFAAFASCKKDPYELGKSLLPPSDTLNLNTNDTTTIVAYSILQDSVRTDETTTSLLGSIQDPVFGNTTAGFYTQLRLSLENPDFGTNPVLDSVVMLLSYAAMYGDTNALQHIRVFEMSQNIFADSSYYSVNHASTYNNVLADMTFKPDPTDSVKVDTVKTAPHLRINLSNITHYFGNKILTAPDDAKLTNTSFLNYMKGLYFETVPRSSGGNLVGFNPYGSMTKLVVYYHNNASDSLQFSLLINTLSARFNTFNHYGYMGADPALRTQVISHDTTLGKNKLYLQGLGGIKIRLRFPYIKNLNKIGKIALNSAVLSIKNFETDTTLKPPPNLNLVRVDSLGKVGFLIDENEGSGYFGGTYNKTKRTYEFRITRHLQQILNGSTKNYDLEFLVNDPTLNALFPYRVVLNGPQPSPPVPSSDRMQLKLVYTKMR